MKSTIFAPFCLTAIGTVCTPPVDRPTATKTSEGHTASGPAAAKAAEWGRALVRFVNAEQTGAPFEIKVLRAEIAKVANALIAADAQRSRVRGEECGPVAVQSITLRSAAEGKVETVVSG